MGLTNGNLTFFNPYFDKSHLLLCAYLIHSTAPRVSTQFTNIRSRSRTSPQTGAVYPQRWTLGVEGRGLLEVHSVFGGDQELVYPGGASPFYVGFARFRGVFDGRVVTGFGGGEVRFVAPT
ncbi:hypothetical protein BJY01DRAFT_250293 [Aspergillus pseudoustus]|uniref:Uncharacterized protein n=1 Tax=Aspergillus pseudoustus TaxID=1810923 RepID=A0ABR4JIF7_9EURO